MWQSFMAATFLHVIATRKISILAWQILTIADKKIIVVDISEEKCKNRECE